MIAEVAFDLPLDRNFLYRVPPEITLKIGQRVKAPLKRGLRLGVVVALRDEETTEPLEAIHEVIDPFPLLSESLLRLTKRVAQENAASWGEALAHALPPPPPRRAVGLSEAAPSAAHDRGAPETPKLLTGQRRDQLLLDALRHAWSEGRGILLLAPEIEDADDWAQALEQELGTQVLRLHSRRPKRERWEGWATLATGSPRCAVGTRSAVFAPLSPNGVLALLDEHDLAHKSLDSPRYHAREVARLRVNETGGALYLTSATPSVECWWQTEDGQIEMNESGASEWPAVTFQDLRNSPAGSPLSPQLKESIASARARGQQVLLLAARIGYAPALTCSECGLTIRCRDCRLTMTYRRSDRTLHCHLCRRVERPRALCRRCRGRQVALSGWGTERVEETVREMFPRAAVVRYDSEATHGARGRTFRAAIQDGSAAIVVGTRSVLRWFRPGSLGAVGVINPDLWLERPDFRASERAWQILWETCERTRDGAVIIQTRHPDHYVMTSIAHQDKPTFYRHELKFRAELGYPPFSRLARIVVRANDASQAEGFATTIHQTLAAHVPESATLYAPAPLTPATRSRQWQLVVKSDQTLPQWVGPALAPFRSRRPSGVRLEIDIDPLEL